MKSFHSDSELVERLKEGDIDAFDLIYEKYSGKLYLFGFKYLKCSAETEELLQSVFLKLWENRKNLVKESSFKSFLFTIAYNDICKIFRKRYYHQKFVNEIMLNNSQTSLEIEEGIEYQFVLNRVQQIVDKLPDKQKTIFRKSRFEGKSTKEIAKELNLSPGTIDNYVSEALKFIRKHLHKNDLSFLLFVTFNFF